ncbi:hypothetical protein P9112_010483 [Eukaryota sp. TZLM1-RC]
MLPKATPGCLRGLRICVLGTHTPYTAAELKSYITSLGASVVNAPSIRTNYAVVGSNISGPVQNLLNRFETSCKAISSDQLFSLIKERSDRDLEEQSQSQSQSFSSPTLTTPLSPSSQSSQPRLTLPKNGFKLPKAKFKLPTDRKLPTLKKPVALPNSQEIPTQPLTQPPTQPPTQPLIDRKIDRQIPSTDIWPEKYRPSSTRDLIGNQSPIKNLIKFLRDFDPRQSQKLALLHGPPGVGKTTTALLVSKEIGLKPLELNASDTRSKSILASLAGDFTQSFTIDSFVSGQKLGDQSINQSVLIMDEVDGMSTGDRGGLAHLIKLSKNSKIPIICIGNDVSDPKFKTLKNHSLVLHFKSPTVEQALPRIKYVAQKEGILIGDDAIKELLTSSQVDLRYTITALQMLSMGKNHISFLDVAEKVDTKQFTQTAFSVIPELFEPLTVSRLSATSQKLGDQSNLIRSRLDLFFVDDLVSLMVQENYIHVPKQPDISPINHLDRLSRASRSISQSDLIGSSITGDQAWHLLPAKGFTSTVYPGAVMSGKLLRTDFPQYLGKLSKSNRFARIINGASQRSFPLTFCNVQEFILNYIPIFQYNLVLPLLNNDIDHVVEFMVNYRLDKEDWDLIVTEFPLVEQFSIEGKVKAKLTRKLNSLGVSFKSDTTESVEEGEEKEKKTVKRKATKPKAVKKKKV